MNEKDPAFVPAREYIASHAKPNGGIRGFFQSNLFPALVIWTLTQAVIVGGLLMSNYWRTVALSEWKGTIDGKIASLEKQVGDNKYNILDHTGRITVNEAAIREIKDDTKHFDVMESENRRLTTAVEKLENAKK